MQILAMCCFAAGSLYDFPFDARGSERVARIGSSGADKS